MMGGIIHGESRKPRRAALPRKWARTTPNAAVVPSNAAIEVATTPTRRLSNSAAVHSVLLKKFKYHRVDTPGNGQVIMDVEVSDIGRTTRTGAIIKTATTKQ